MAGYSLTSSDDTGLKSTCMIGDQRAARSIFEWLLEVKPENGLGQHFYFRGRLKERILLGISRGDATGFKV